MEEEDKPKLSFDDLANRLKHEKGIIFDDDKKSEVINYLKYQSYYYKIASYRKNFPKNSDGKYLDLHFDTLTEIEELDNLLHAFLFNMCIDIEHMAKTNLMTMITNNASEDGYSLIDEFSRIHPNKFEEIMSRFEKSIYQQDMYSKRNQISIWVFMEIIDFGTLISMCEIYFTKYPEDYSAYYKQYKFVKNIRNTCAHNNVFLINMFHKSMHIPRPDVTTKSYAKNMDINVSLVCYLKIIDIINLFYIHKNICSNVSNTKRAEESKIVFKKFDSLTCTSERLQKFFSILNKCVDFLT